MSESRAKNVSVVIVVLAALMLGLLCMLSAPQSAHAASSVKWKVSKSEVYCYVDGKKAKGLKEIKGKVYYFDKKGRQYTGWMKDKDGLYRFFKIKCGKGGYMVKKTVVNGIKLDKNGAAMINKTAIAELKLMVKANSTMHKLTKAKWSKLKKLKACFKYQVRDCVTCGTRPFVADSSWHRRFAADIINKARGSCESHAAGFAYFANACGYKDCRAICSGGHAWAEVDGLVYDPQWSAGRRNCYAYFAVPYSQSGVNGTPDYKNNRTYVVKLNRTKLWGGKVKKASKSKPVKTSTSAAVKTGIHVVKNQLTYYDSKGNVDTQKTNALRNAAVVDQDASALLALMGTPTKTQYIDSCKTINDIGGKDGFIYFKHVKIITFKCDDGIEYFEAAEEL